MTFNVCMPQVSAPLIRESTAPLFHAPNSVADDSSTMNAASRKANVTDEHREEARRLRQIWVTKGRQGQAAFGEEFGIGGQSAVSGFLAGTSALSVKAAIGFARGLGCQVSDFSPRLAAMVDSHHAASVSTSATLETKVIRRSPEQPAKAAEESPPPYLRGAPPIGIMIQQLGTMVQSLTPMQRAGIAPLIQRVFEEPDLAGEAAATADRIASKKP